MGETTVAVAVAGAGAVTALLASPYLAALTISVPDRDAAAWWRVRPRGGVRCAVTAVIAIAFAAMAGAAAGWTGAWPAYLVFALAGAVLSVVDVEHHRLPDRLLRPAAVVAALVFTVVAAVGSDWRQLARAALAAAAVFAVLSVSVLIAPAGLGFGDVKLAAVVAGCLGWRSWRAAGGGFLLAVLLAGAAAVVLLVARRGGVKTHIPLGPFLIVAALIMAAIPG